MRPLARALRDLSERVCDSTVRDPDLADLIPAKAAYDIRTAADLVRVLAHVVDGMPLVKALGAPGDWGYGRPIGDGVLALLSEPKPLPHFDEVSSFGPKAGD